MSAPVETQGLPSWAKILLALLPAVGAAAGAIGGSRDQAPAVAASMSEQLAPLTAEIREMRTDVRSLSTRVRRLEDAPSALTADPHRPRD